MTTTDIRPKHRIEIVHSWEEIDRTWSETGRATIVERCQHCGAERQVHVLGQESGPSLRESSPEELLALLRRNLEGWGEVAKSIGEMFERLAHDSDYDSIEDVIKEIDKRSQGVVDGSNLPYWQLQLWLSEARSFKLRGLLEFFQGPVCNRCDRIFSHSVQPTVDHIDGNRKNARPSNLQLLCDDCNVEKGSNPPDYRDISPFTFEGASCVHRLTCVELHALQSDHDDAEEASA